MRALPRRRWSEIEDLSREELEALQLKRLKAQVERLIATNPFHRERFAEAGVGPETLKSVADIRLFPMLVKSDVLEDTGRSPPFGRRLGIDPKDIREIVTSGGTAGRQPEVFAYSREDLEQAVELYAMDQHWKGAEPGDVGMMVGQLGMLLSPPLNTRAWEKIGMAVLRVGPNSTEERVAAFQRFKPSILKLPYVYTLRFMDACREMGVDPRRDVPNLKFVFMSGGAYPLEFAEMVSDFFGAPLHEVFGCSQGGTVVSGTCEHGVRLGPGQRGHMHVYDQEFVVEVLNRETGEPVGDGEEGEMVITQLNRAASPVFRYRMNDRVRWFKHGNCPCGRPFSSFECGTIARYDDMLKIKGMNVWTHDIDNFILADPQVDEYNGLLTVDERGREVARVLVEVKRAVISPDAHEPFISGLSARLRDAFRVGFDIEIVPPGTVRRFELKQRRWTDERAKRLGV